MAVLRVSRDLGLAFRWLCLLMSLGRQLVAPPCAAAQSVHGSARVNTLVDACVPIDPDQFHRVLAIELGTSIEYSPTAAQQPGGTLVRVVCTDDGAVQLQLEDNLTRKSMQRVVELPAVDIATRSRLLALSVAEFVVASWVELRLSAQAPLAPAGPPVPDAAAQRASALAAARLPATESAAPNADDSLGPAWILGVSVEPMFFTQGSRLLPQLSLHLEQRPSAHLALELALSLGHASWNVHWPTQNAGAANVTSSSGRLSFGYVANLSPTPLELSVRAGARGGVVFMAGATARNDLLAEELYAPWAGPVLLLTAATHFGPVRLLLELEAGYVTLPAQALIKGTDIIVAEISGFWGSAGLGLGWIF